jgi:hypothetical protein
MVERQGRQRLGFVGSFRVACQTTPLWGVAVLQAFHWWVRGVPDDKIALSETPSLWDRASRRERQWLVAYIGLVLVAIALLVVLTLAAEPR